MNLFASGNHASDISGSVAFRGGILHRNGIEGTRLSPFLQTPNEVERDSWLQAGVHFHSDWVWKKGRSGGKDFGFSWA